jgi:flavorubredoxin
LPPSPMPLGTARYLIARKPRATTASTIFGFPEDHMATILFEQPGHRCVAFSDLVRGEDGIQANQFLILHGQHSALLDPGGALLYNPLILAMGDYLLLPDEGGVIPMGDTHVRAVPAHFMHSVGNFGFYDPISRILFSGDVGSSLISSLAPYAFVSAFDAHVAHMAGFHRRYMASNRVTRLWVQMVRELNPSMIVPQHGLPLRGDAMARFLDWLAALECGVDLVGPASYRVVGV